MNRRFFRTESWAPSLLRFSSAAKGSGGYEEVAVREEGWRGRSELSAFEWNPEKHCRSIQSTQRRTGSVRRDGAGRMAVDQCQSHTLRKLTHFSSGNRTQPDLQEIENTQTQSSLRKRVCCLYVILLFGSTVDPTVEPT